MFLIEKYTIGFNRNCSQIKIKSLRELWGQAL